MKRIRILDSHTAGEPTRVVLDGGPGLGSGTLAQRAQRFREQFDHYRCAIVNEPRGSDVFVGALLVEPAEAGCAAGVVFFNNTGYLGMCGHGSIGVIATLAHLGRIGPGRHRLDTPVGVVSATLHGDGSVSIGNVPSWRRARAVTVDVPGYGKLDGDIAWGGNWFFLVERHDENIDVANVPRLLDFTARIRSALAERGFGEVDHVELFAPGGDGADSRNFVLCPGGEYDRSPCGTGTSAKLACLAADGRLDEGATWVQASIIGSLFSASYRWRNRDRGEIDATITGRAHLMAESTLLLDPDDPLCWGIRSPARDGKDETGR